MSTNPATGNPATGNPATGNPALDKLPTFTEWFDGKVAQKKQQIHKASDQDAFDAARQEVAETFGVVPDSGFKAYQDRKYGRKKSENPGKLSQ